MLEGEVWLCSMLDSRRLITFVEAHEQGKVLGVCECHAQDSLKLGPKGARLEQKGHHKGCQPANTKRERHTHTCIEGE